MKIKATLKGKEAKEVLEKRQKTGRRSKTKGGNYERDLAKKFKTNYEVELVRTPQSGGFAKNITKAKDFRGDIVPADSNVNLKLHIEAKNCKTWSLPKWLEQAESDCPKDKMPIVAFHKHGTSKDYVCLSLDDFFKLVPKELIINFKQEE